MGFLKKFTKQEISWMMYDWANSAHSVIVVTILPIFFDTVAGYTADSVSSMSTWGFATSLAMAIVALSAPFLGVFGDIRGMRKKLFTAFMLIGVVSVAGLSFTPFMDFTASPDAAGRVAAIVLVLYITSTIGFDADDVAAVQKADGVVAAAGSVNADFIWQHDNKERVYRAHMLTDSINEPVLTAGRMPENGSECLIDSSRFSEGMIGQTIEISDSNNEDTKKNFKYSTYTVVGLADSPLYIHTLRGTTSLGDGTLQGFVLIPEDGFDFEYYTELYVTCTDEFPLYSDDYDDYIDTFSDTVEAAATASVNARFDRLTSDGKAEISDAEIGDYYFCSAFPCLVRNFLRYNPVCYNRIYHTEIRKRIRKRLVQL